jgi:hypothetical protein
MCCHDEMKLSIVSERLKKVLQIYAADTGHAAGTEKMPLEQLCIMQWIEDRMV